MSDSGEGRWSIAAAIDEAVPVPVLSAALNERFSSHGEADFANCVLSAMRKQFGEHDEKVKIRDGEEDFSCASRDGEAQMVTTATQQKE